MTGTKPCRLFLSLLWICLVFGTLAGQEQGGSTSSSPQSGQSPAAAQQNPPQNPNAEFSQELAKTSDEASEEAGKKDAKLAMELKAEHSPVVRWIGRMIRISPESAYVLSLIINFGILIGFFWVLLKAKVPQMFRDRTAMIQKGIREAQAASAEASRRLHDIEERLAKLDTEVARDSRLGRERGRSGGSANPAGGGRRQRQGGAGRRSGDCRHRAQCPPRIEELCGIAGG